MSITIDIRELAANFAEIMARAEEEDEEVIVTESGVPRATLEAIPLPSGKPVIFDMHPGSIIMHEDFDKPLTEEEWGGDM